MPIADFEYKEFAKNLAQQASSVIPEDVSKSDKDYIVSLVLNFCNMSGEALYNDTEYQYTAESAYTITQFIGEWTFHKSIDLIHGKIPRQYRDKILQQIAFTVFEIAKQCVKQNMSQPEVIQIVEAQVQKTYYKALEELQKRGALSSEQAQNAAKMSNLDEMSKQQPGAGTSDTKLLKLVSFAMVLRTMPQDKVQTILQKFSPDDASILVEYIKMDDLEHKLDQSIVSKYLEEIKMNMPAPTKMSMPNVVKKVGKIVKSADPKRVSRVISRERPFIKDFVLPEKGSAPKLTPRIADIVCQHLEEKVLSKK